MFQKFLVEDLKRHYCVTREFNEGRDGPYYLLIDKPEVANGGNYIVDYCNEEEEVVGFETKEEAVGAVIQYMMRFETEC